MTTRAQVVVYVLAALVFLTIVVLVRRGTLKERFALVWLGIGSGVVALAVIRPWLDGLSDLLGIRSGTTTLFLASNLFLLGLVMHLSVNLSRQQEKLRDLAEAVAILDARRPSDLESPATIGPPDDRKDGADPEA